MTQERILPYASVTGHNAPVLDPRWKHHICISHSEQEQDIQIYEELRTDIKNCGYTVYEIPPGNPVNVLNEEMDKCWKIICLITESYMDEAWQELEIANHLEKAAFEKRRLVIPILHGRRPEQVPSYVKEINYLQTTDDCFWEKLFRALKDDSALADMIPTRYIADGLAWSYYYGYLCLILPGLRQRIRSSIIPDIYPKFILLMPRSGKSTGNIKDLDSNITHMGKLEFRTARAANKTRDFSNTVVRLQETGTNQELYAIVEFATPLFTLYEMENGRISGLATEDKQLEMDDFRDKLTAILNSSAELSNLYIIIAYDDQELSFQQDVHALSRLIIRHIRADREAGQS